MANSAEPQNDKIDLGDEPDMPEDIPLAVLEEKYREQMRQIFPTRIDLPMFTLVTQIDAQIELRPDFQRRDRWSDEKRSRFIESIIMNVPVPPVFLGEEQYGKYVVLDGRQRLTAAYRFLTNQLTLTGLKVWDELNNSTFDDLKRKGFGATIERRFLPAVLLTRESSPQVKYEVFDRLNTGGIQASPMEVRNAVFPGPFKDQIVSLSEDSDFRRLWGIPVSADKNHLESSTLYRDMSDLELVLRFFALRDASLKGMRFKDWLSEYMSAQNAIYQAEPERRAQDAALFQRAVRNASRIFGEDAFRRPDDGAAKGRRSAPYSDAVMHALADHAPAIFEAGEIADKVRTALWDLARNSKPFVSAISSGTNGDGAVRTRITLARRAVHDAINQSPVAGER